ncbi:hypothetical protein SASPL_154341 [Salvia splendens]|uniref:MSP domain-containing protein n=1 Tax=Salvia splendens TaxID=180675 RepID=A0A8X8VZX7_SALSN|nr:hypothetical protein SASPL_154341 [Salvia splendens]
MTATRSGGFSGCGKVSHTKTASLAARSLRDCSSLDGGSSVSILPTNSTSHMNRESRAEALSGSTILVTLTLPSSYMRPPGGILAPGESLIATVFKFMELPQSNQKRKAKFKIISLKVKQGTDYVPELFDEQRDDVVVERVLQVVYLDPERPNPALEKLERQLAEADAAIETRKKPRANAGPKMIAEGLVLDEWRERREKYLARQRVQAVDSA